MPTAWKAGMPPAHHLGHHDGCIPEHCRWRFATALGLGRQAAVRRHRPHSRCGWSPATGRPST
eukprot:5871720-Alexandrium_andersonii.AAC.1